MLSVSLLGVGLLSLGRLDEVPRPAIAPETSLPVLDPNQAPFPDSALVDFSATLDPPAGKHGFLFVGTDGHFYFEDGTRGRFWGINVAKDSAFVPHETIEQAADVIARAGFNLVRLHHIDGVEGLLPAERAGAAERIDPEKLDAIFYWVHALKARGIHAYLDLLDFRTFQEAEGVPQAAALGRGAKPAAVFNERLIELQIEYARSLLADRVNPYTNLPLGRDPAVVMVELCDENGLFARMRKWGEMPAPYLAELQARWNFWLRSRYGNTETLRQAWQEPDGRSALGFDERLEDASVRLTGVGSRDADFPSPTGAPRVGMMTSTRQADLYRCCQSLHRDYFAEMKRALRAAGVRAPITAVTDWEVPADLGAVAEELDFIGCNWYYDHPIFSAGREWRVPSFYTNTNPIADEVGQDFASSALRAAVAGKPLVLREWGACWPSKFRGVGLLEATAYASLQDLDAMIMFTYNTNPDVRRMEYFDVSSDPVRWGPAALAGYVFRTRALDAARAGVVLRRPEEECFAPDARAPAAAFRLGWTNRLRQLLGGATPPLGYERVLSLTEAAAGAGDLGAYAADTGQIKRLVDEERLVLDAPRLQAVAGALTRQPMATSAMAFGSASPIGVIAALSLDDKPLGSSEALLVKMVTVAANTGEQKGTRPAPPGSPQFKLDAFGDAPVLTHGEPTDQPTTVDLAGSPLLSVYQQNGAWEVVRAGNAWYLWSDAPGARFSLPRLGGQVKVTPFTADGAGETHPVAQPIGYPKGCLFARVTAG
ncbi:MAG: hypothetical protein FJX74_07505 [Armatimonadetes bacterium]|nr:hypothetical protein [Armatimonadota bacterium]